MKREGPRAVADLLVNVLPELRERLVEDRLRRTWSVVVGPDVARRTRPQSVTNGCLSVVVDNSPWLQELTLRAGELTAKIAARCDAVRALRFTLGRVDEAPASPDVAGAVPRALAPEEVRDIEAAVAPIPDPEVRASARRLLDTARRHTTPQGAA